MKNTKVSINKNMPGNAGNATIGEGTMASVILREHLEQIAKNGDRLEEVVAELRKMSENTRTEPSYKFTREDSYGR